MKINEYPPIDDLILARNMDLILETIINDYPDRPNEDLVFYGEQLAYNINNKGYTLNKDEVGSLIQSMIYFNLLDHRTISGRNRFLFVTNLGHFIHNNGGLQKRIVQEISDRKLAIQVNKSSIKTNQHQKINIWLTFAVACFATFTSWKQYIHDENKNNQNQLLEDKIILIQTKLTNMDSTLNRLKVHSIEAPNQLILKLNEGMLKNK